MFEVWIKINECLNFYGGLIGAISFVVSILIYLKTGQIKNNIKNLLNHDKYVEQKKKAKKKFQGLLESIEEDGVFDNKILGEIHREISALDHYAVFFDRKMRKNMKYIKQILDNPKPEAKEVTIAINKIIGDLDVDDTYLG